MPQIWSLWGPRVEQLPVPTEYPGPACRRRSVAAVRGGCMSVPGLCSGHTALDRARPKGPAASHPPASPVFYVDLLPPQNLLALDLDVVQGLPALQPQHRPQTGSFKPCVPGSVPAPSATEQASAPGSAGGRDTRLRAAGAGAQARRGLGPPWASLGPWLLRSGFAPQ